MHPVCKEVRLTYCPKCNEDGEELVIGEVYKYFAEDGVLLGYGHPGGSLGVALTNDEVKYTTVPLTGNDRAPGSHICSNCYAALRMQGKRFEELVIAGGVHWWCEDCLDFGVIVNEDSVGFCVGARAAAGVQPPNQLRVNFERCAQHRSAEDPHSTLQ